MADSDDDFDFLLQLAESAAVGDQDQSKSGLPSLLIKDDDKLLEEAYGRDYLRKASQPSSSTTTQVTRLDAGLSIPKSLGGTVSYVKGAQLADHNQQGLKPSIATSAVQPIASLNSEQQPGARPLAQPACYIEHMSKLRVSRPVVGSLVVRDRLSDGAFVKLSQLRQGPPSAPGSWTTLAILVSKATSEGRDGRPYSRWQVTDFVATATLFLFGQAHQELYKESEGSVVILYSPKYSKEEGASKYSSNGSKFTLTVEKGAQVQRIGASPDLGSCSGTKKDGNRCGMPVNRSECEFCIYHAQTALKRLAVTGTRPDLAGGGRSYLAKTMQMVAKRGPDMTRPPPKPLLPQRERTGAQLQNQLQQRMDKDGRRASLSNSYRMMAAVAQQQQVVDGRAGDEGAGLKRRRSTGADVDELSGGGATEVTGAKAKLIEFMKMKKEAEQKAAQEQQQRRQQQSLDPEGQQQQDRASKRCRQQQQPQPGPMQDGEDLDIVHSADQDDRPGPSDATEEGDDLEIVPDEAMDVGHIVRSSASTAATTGATAGAEPDDDLQIVPEEDGDGLEQPSAAAAQQHAALVAAAEATAPQQGSGSQVPSTAAHAGAGAAAASARPVLQASQSLNVPSVRAAADNKRGPAAAVAPRNTVAAGAAAAPRPQQPLAARGVSAVLPRPYGAGAGGAPSKQAASAADKAKSKLLSNLGLNKHHPLAAAARAVPGGAAAQRSAAGAGGSSRQAAPLPGRQPRPQLQAVGHSRAAAASCMGKSAMELAFGALVGTAPDKDCSSRYEDLVDDAEFDALHEMMEKAEKRDAIATKLDSVTKLEVQAWHCPQCNRMSEYFDKGCKGHGPTKVRTTKRFWTCGHCNGYFTTLGVIHPTKRCPKCNDHGMDFKPATMYRGPKGNGKPDSSSALAQRANFQARGTEHAFSLK